MHGCHTNMISYILAKTLTRLAFRILTAQTRKRPQESEREQLTSRRKREQSGITR
uniref:Uncharacterized protein n=1 Tax=Anguilla anguilla TaxID=7936 RepID=A0A0E9XPJ7_ANGAN